MEIILIILTSTIISTLLWCAFLLGRKTQPNERVKVDKTNIKNIKELADWLNYRG